MDTMYGPAADALASQLRSRPRIAVIAGSGIMRALEGLMLGDPIPMASLPDMPLPNIEGHGASVVETLIGDIAVLVFTGRVHLYEGYAPTEVVASIDIAHGIGITHVIVTNATGGLHPMLQVGDVVMPTDIIDLTFTPLTAHLPVDVRIDTDWRARTVEACVMNGHLIHSGTYVQVTGPSYETRAEIAMLRHCGADIVGMSTAIEVKRACLHGMRPLVCSMVTNVLSDTVHRRVTHDEVLQAAERAVGTISGVVSAAVHAADGLSLQS